MAQLFTIPLARMLAPASQVIGPCTGKASFPAYAIANHVQKRRRAKGKAGDVYQCQACGKWHIGRVGKL